MVVLGYSRNITDQDPFQFQGGSMNVQPIKTINKEAKNRIHSLDCARRVFFGQMVEVSEQNPGCTTGKGVSCNSSSMLFLLGNLSKIKEEM